MKIDKLNFSQIEMFEALSRPTQTICKRLSHLSAVCPTDLDFITRAQPFLTEYLIYPHVAHTEKELVLDFVASETRFKQAPENEHYRNEPLAVYLAEILKQLEKRDVDVESLRAHINKIRRNNGNIS